MEDCRTRPASPAAALADAPHLDRLRDLGAEDAFDYHTTDPRYLGRFDVILDPVSKGMRPTAGPWPHGAA